MHIYLFPSRFFRFAVGQALSRTQIQYYFNTFNSYDWELQIQKIKQLTGGTETAAAITSVV